MGLLDRFRSQPSWRHRDPALRLAAVEALPLDDQATLEAVAREDAEASVRRAAVKKLFDPAVIREVRDGDADAGVRDEAATVLLDIALGAFEGTEQAQSLAALAAMAEPKDLVRLAKEAADPAVAAAALERVDDEKAVGSIARRSAHPDIRMAALTRVTDPLEVAAIALRTEFKDVGCAAVDRIHDRDTLEAIAARARNRAAVRQARLALRGVPEAGAPPAPEPPAAAPAPVTGEPAAVVSSGPVSPAEALCARVEALRESRDRVDAAARLAEAEQEWTALGETEGALVARFEAAAGQIRVQLAEADARDAEAARRAAAVREAVARRVALCERVEGIDPTARPAAAAELEGEDQPAGVPPDATLKALEEAIAAWAALPPFEADEADVSAVARRFEAACQECRRRHGEAVAQRARQARLAALSEQAEAIAAQEPLAEARRRWQAWRLEWGEAVALPGEPPDAEVQARVGEAETRLRAREQAAREARREQERENLARLEQLAAGLDALAQADTLTLKDADRGARDLRAALDNLGPMPSRREREAMVDRLKSIQARLMPRLQELKEAEEWQRWANATIQEDLCRRAEALAAVEDAGEAARELRELQAQWKKVSAAPRGQSQALWLRFRAAGDALRARTDAYFAEQAGERAANLERKEALCQQAETLAGSSDWIKTAEAIKQLQVEWKAIGPVTRGREKAVWERFRAACDQFFTRRREDLAHRKGEWAKNHARKEQLIATIDALVAPEDWDRAADEVRRLQAEWRAIGPVRKKHADALWERFQQATTRFFERFAQRDELQMMAHVAAREAICEELESLAPSGSEPADAAGPVVDRLRGAWSRWEQAGQVPSDRLGALTERFRAAFAAVVSAFPDAVHGSEFDTESNLQRMRDLCEQVEQLRPQEPTAGEVDQSPAAILATRWREALAANTIGGAAVAATEEARRRADMESVKAAQAAWKRIGPVPDDLARPLAVRFQKACTRVLGQPRDRRRTMPPGQARR